jgi:hypothetical protein
VSTTTQRRSARASSGTGLPTILIDLISIYVDEEGLKASHITPVPITQEEEPVETSTPTFDVLIPNPQEGDHEARSTLDTKFIDQLGTHLQNDSSKNDLGTGEKEEEMKHP